MSHIGTPSGTDFMDNVLTIILLNDFKANTSVELYPKFWLILIQIRRDFFFFFLASLPMPDTSKPLLIYSVLNKRR